MKTRPTFQPLMHLQALPLACMLLGLTPVWGQVAGPAKGPSALSLPAAIPGVILRNSTHLEEKISEVERKQSPLFISGKRIDARPDLDMVIEGDALLRKQGLTVKAQRIEYDSKAQTVVFTGSAVLRRYRGTQLNDESVGNQITYNSLTEVFTVKGGPANRTAANPSGRVRAMLTPIPEAETAPAPAATDPAQLRPSTNLNEKKK